MKNIIRLSKFHLKNNKRFLLIWAFGVFSMMFLYMILFDSMKELGQAKLEAMPKEMLQLFGVEDMNVMSNWLGYFDMVYGLFVLVVSFFAASFAANSIYQEEKTKSIEFLAGLEVSRKEIYFAKVLSSFVAVIILHMAMIISAAICGSINGGETYVFMDFMTLAKVKALAVYFFCSLGLMFAGISAKISPAAISSALVFMTYMLGYLGELLKDKLAFLKRMSPFQTFTSSTLLPMTNGAMISIGVFSLLTIAFIVVGYVFYKKRDFSI